MLVRNGIDEVYTWQRFLCLISHTRAQYLIIIPIVLMAGAVFLIIDIVTGKFWARPFVLQFCLTVINEHRELSGMPFRKSLVNIFFQRIDT